MMIIEHDRQIEDGVYIVQAEHDAGTLSPLARTFRYTQPYDYAMNTLSLI